MGAFELNWAVLPLKSSSHEAWERGGGRGGKGGLFESLILGGPLPTKGKDREGKARDGMGRARETKRKEKNKQQETNTRRLCDFLR